MFRYRINIARDGRHLFRVELGVDGNADGDTHNFEKVYTVLKERFPDCEVTASRQPQTWQKIK